MHELGTLVLAAMGAKPRRGLPAAPPDMRDEHGAEVESRTSGLFVHQFINDLGGTVRRVPADYYEQQVAAIDWGSKGAPFH